MNTRAKSNRSLTSWATGLMSLAALLVITSCQHEPPFLTEDLTGGGGGPGPVWVDPDPCDPDSVYFENTVLPLLITYCAGTGCHDAITHEEGVRLYDYNHIMQLVSPGNPGNSDLWDDAINENGGDAMPPSGEPQMTAAQEQAVYTWIMQGAQNNGCSQCDTVDVTYAANIQPLMQNKCNGCHSGSNPDGGLNFSSWAVCNTVALDGRLAGAVQHQTGYTAMPPGSSSLQPCEIDQILMWIGDGAVNN